jgi:hypothetical protein
MSVVQDLLAWWWAICLLGILLAPMVLVDRFAVDSDPSFGLFDGLWSRQEMVSGKEQSVVAPHSTFATAHGLKSLFAPSDVFGISGQGT